MNDATQKQRQIRNRFIAQQIIGGVVFLIGVISCYQGALRGIPWLGPLVVLVIAVVHFALEKDRWPEIQLVLAVGIVAFIMESVLIVTSVYTVNPKTRWVIPAPLCPAWLLALWINFGIKLKEYLPRMKGKHIASAITGLVFGLIIFYNAAKMGILSLMQDVVSLAIIAILWAILVPVLFQLASKMLPSTSQNSMAKDSQASS